jgi:hypothetical protein
LKTLSKRRKPGSLLVILVGSGAFPPPGNLKIQLSGFSKEKD